MNIVLNLTLDEVNYVLSVIQKRPFEEVSSLVTKVRIQAQTQFQAGQARLEKAKETEVPDTVDNPKG